MSLEIVINMMHIAGHVDEWCDPPFLSGTFPSIYYVDTEVCEQTLSHPSILKDYQENEKIAFYVLFFINS